MPDTADRHPALTFKAAVRHAKLIQAMIHLNGAGSVIAVTRTAILRSDLYDFAPDAVLVHKDSAPYAVAEDEDGRTVWTLDGAVLTLG